MNEPTPTSPGRRAVPIVLTACQRLDIVLLPYIRPGTPLRQNPGHARLALNYCRRAVLIAAAVKGEITNVR